MKKIIKSSLITFLLLLTSVTLVACGEEEVEVLTESATEFVVAVEDIGEVTLNSWTKISGANRLYEFLTNSEKAFNKVIEAKSDLDVKNETFNRLEDEEDNQSDDKVEMEKVNKFINFVNLLPSVTDLTKNDRPGIIDAQYDYDDISSSYKTRADVVEAYAKYVAAKNKVEELCATDDLNSFNSFINSISNPVTVDDVLKVATLQAMYNDLSSAVKNLSGYQSAETKYLEIVANYNKAKNEYDITIFLGYIDELSKVSLNSLTAINNATYKFNEMSQEALSNEDVIAGKIILDEAVVKYNELYAADQTYKIEKMIDLVNSLPESSEVTKSEYNTLYDILNLYNGLSNASKSTEEVRLAYNTYKAVQVSFDAKGFEKIKADLINASIGSTNKPDLSFYNFTTLGGNILRDNFGVNLTSFSAITAELEKNNIAFVMYIYSNDNTTMIASCIINYKDIQLGMLVDYAKMCSYLEVLSQSNDSIVSGGTYSFAFNFIDTSDNFIPSDISLPTDETNLFVWGEN